MNPRILFTVDGQVVGSTRSRNQQFIRKLVRALADLYLNRTVEIVYPEAGS